MTYGQGAATRTRTKHGFKRIQLRGPADLFAWAKALTADARRLARVSGIQDTSTEAKAWLELLDRREIDDHFWTPTGAEHRSEIWLEGPPRLVREIARLCASVDRGMDRAAALEDMRDRLVVNSGDRPIEDDVDSALDGAPLEASEAERRAFVDRVLPLPWRPLLDASRQNETLPARAETAVAPTPPGDNELGPVESSGVSVDLGPVMSPGVPALRHRHWAVHAFPNEHAAHGHGASSPPSSPADSPRPQGQERDESKRSKPGSRVSNGSRWRAVLLAGAAGAAAVGVGIAVWSAWWLRPETMALAQKTAPSIATPVVEVPAPSENRTETQRADELATAIAHGDRLERQLKEALAALEVARQAKSDAVEALKRANEALRHRAEEAERARDDARRQASEAQAVADSLRGEIEVARARIAERERQLHSAARASSPQDSTPVGFDSAQATAAPARVAAPTTVGPGYGGTSPVLAADEARKARWAKEPCLLGRIDKGMTPREFSSRIGLPLEVVYVLNNWTLTLNPYNPATGQGERRIDLLGPDQRAWNTTWLYVPPEMPEYGNIEVKELSVEQRRQVDEHRFSCQAPFVVQRLAEAGLKVGWYHY